MKNEGKVWNDMEADEETGRTEKSGRYFRLSYASVLTEMNSFRICHLEFGNVN